MKILEAGSLSGGCLEAVLNQIGSAYASYTYAEPSERLSNEAKRPKVSDSSRLSFLTLDLGHALERGAIEGIYDVVIFSQLIISNQKLYQIFDNIRRLLKAGGYLFILQTMDPNSIRMRTILNTPNLYTGSGEQQILTSSNQIQNALLQAGFSGIDSITTDETRFFRPFSVILSQAVDGRIRSLRDPLAPNSISLRVQHLVIVGGLKSQTMRLVDEVIGLMTPRAALIIHAQSLKQLFDKDIPAMSTILSLLDLDEPVFKSLSRESFKALKSLFDQSRSVLWITRGARTDEPYCRATYGFGRTLQLEMPYIALQFLDNEGAYVTTEDIVETLLRQQMLEKIEKEGKLADILWSKEPELLLKDGKLLVPRIKPNEARNDRLNAHRRPIYSETNPQISATIMTRSSTGFELSQDYELSKNTLDDITIN
ncbi:MAG: hypothetical protein Q9214_007389, partial [Letrouitia sp. 1 TL-2023]